MIECNEMIVKRGSFTLSASIDIPAGSICAIIGPSGGGKSTLLEALGGFAPLTSGSIKIAGEEVSDQPPSKRPLTLLFQENNLFPHLTIAANVGLGVRPALTLSTAERALVEEALNQVGLDGMADRKPEQLSGGQRQRAALARALLREKPVLLLDEPLAALGPALREEMLTLLETTTRERGLTTLIVTHAPDEARRIAHLTAFCADGKITGAQPTAEMFSSPSAELASYLGGQN